MNWVTADGGALDRSVVVAGLLLALSSTFMLVVTVGSGSWGPAAFWAVVLLLAVAAFVRFALKVRRAGRA